MDANVSVTNIIGITKKRNQQCKVRNEDNDKYMEFN